tara:strand:+ start:299 stop:649 length:351 start_codon:yes stop_codon:yes gene_type:complete
MKATELRIGNWYQVMTIGGYWHNRTMTVENLQSIDGCSIDVAKPIPLTEEWLERFGFEYSDLNGDSGLWKIPPFQIYGKYNQFIYDYKLDVNYVHQLQNLYFALTGEELNQSKEDE